MAPDRLVEPLNPLGIELHQRALFLRNRFVDFASEFGVGLSYLIEIAQTVLDQHY